jgi:predicted Zn-dependent peptidase
MFASMEYQLFSLKNGLRVLHKPNPCSAIVHACVVINCGSRDEDSATQGLAHFIEHMLFKGTSTKTLYNILNRMEVVGGELNAYTSKEQTCIHASFLKPHLDRAIELFADLLFNSTFPEHEILKEKQVIMDEIDSYLDLPEEAIQDDFESIIFDKHALGANILGSKKTVANIQRNHLLKFTKKHYCADDIVIGVYGNVSEKELVDIANKYFSKIKKHGKDVLRIKPNKYKAQQVVQKKNCVQSHAVIGSRAYSIHHKDKTALLLLNNYLGGPGMSSRLNMEIREKKGICYAIDANYTPMSDTGIFSVYMGTDAEKMEKCMNLVMKELKLLCENKLSTLALSQAKKKFIGQISLAEENHLSVLIAFCKSILDHGKADTIEQIYAKIESVTAEDMLRIANDVFDERNLSSLLFLPD